MFPPQSFNDVADKLKQVRELNLNVDLNFIHPNRIKRIYRAASRYEPHMFRRFPERKKYALYGKQPIRTTGIMSIDGDVNQRGY